MAGAVKSPALAALLSLVWMGLGQLYLGQMRTGLLMMGLELAFTFVTVGVGPFVMLCTVNIWIAIRAHRDAVKLNAGSPIWDDLRSWNPPASG